jgi:hypothetical protein
VLNEGVGGYVNDLAGNHSGTFESGINSPSWDDDHLSFDGNDHIKVDSAPALSFTNNYSFVVGVKTTTTADYDYLLAKHKLTSSWDGWGFAFHSGRPAHWSNVGGWDDGPEGYNDGNYHQVGCTHECSNVNFYADGKFSNTEASAEGSANSAYDLHIGARSDDDYGFTGDIYYVYIYNRVLSEAEFTQLYINPYCMFEMAIRPELICPAMAEVSLAGSVSAQSATSVTLKLSRKVAGTITSNSDITALLKSVSGSPEIKRDWLKEALFNGMTANAFKLGTTLSLGWFWIRVAGCSVLCRGLSMEQIDFTNILTVADRDACVISPPGYLPHNSSSTYFYVIRRFNNCGYQEHTLAAAAKISINAGGELEKPQPNKVFSLRAEQIGGNKVRFVWFYCPLEQKSKPTCFNVYYDGQTGQIDYENPLATISYQGRRFYSYQSDNLEAGEYLFAVIAEDTCGEENNSLAKLRIQLASANTEPIGILSVESL